MNRLFFARFNSYRRFVVADGKKRQRLAGRNILGRLSGFDILEAEVEILRCCLVLIWFIALLASC